MDLEGRYRIEPKEDATPARYFDRLWAATVLEEAARQLQADYDKRGNRTLFVEIREFLSGDPTEQRYAVVAESLGMSEGAVRTAVHRARRRFGEILRAEVARTVSSEDQIDEEIRYLFSAMS